MKLILTFSILIVFSHLSAFSQNELAVVTYNIGVGVKESRSDVSKTITTLQVGDLFLCDGSNSFWRPVQRFKDKVGYVHIGDVKLVKDLPSDEQTFVILNILFKMQDFINSNDSTEESTSLHQSFEQSEFFYAVDLIPDLYKKTSDPCLLGTFLEILATNQSPASEISLLTLGQLYIDHPELVVHYMDMKEETERVKLINYLKQGFEMMTFAREDQVDNYQVLNNNLNFIDSNTRLSASVQNQSSE